MVKKVFIGIFCVLFSNFVLKASIIEVESWINPASQPQIEKNHFILVDFWATWCGPCIAAMDHIGELQKAVGHNLTVISLSNEKEDVVKSFFKTRNFKSYVATDFQGHTFEKFSVTSIPYSILLSPDGSVIWKGQPSELNIQKLNGMLSGTANKGISIQDRISTFAVSKVLKHEKPSLHKKEGRLESNFNVPESFIPFNRFVNCKNYKLSGSIEEIILSLMHVPISNITNKNKNPIYGYFSFNTCLTKENRNQIIKHLLELNNIKIDSQIVQKEAFIIKIKDKTLLWSNEIFNWSDDFSPSTISDEETIEADNYSIAELALVLSNLLKLEIRCADLSDNKTYDWNLKISDFPALKDQLASEYGLTMEKVLVSTNKYSILKR